jgi:hypothetical protein
MMAQVFFFEKEGEKLFSSFLLLFEVKRKTKKWAGKEPKRLYCLIYLYCKLMTRLLMALHQLLVFLEESQTDRL